MARPAHREPLVKKQVSIAKRQWDALETIAVAEERSVSYFVREAVDDLIEKRTAEESQSAKQVPA